MVLTAASVTAERLHVSIIFDLNLWVFVLQSSHAEEPGYSVGGCRNRHPSEGADEAHPKTYGTISCSCALALNTSHFVKCSFFGFAFAFGRKETTFLMCLILCLQLGIHGYAFAITNNGYILTHPDLRPLVIHFLNANFTPQQSHIPLFYTVFVPSFPFCAYIFDA